jgi:SAM-dependent methyltransferase
MLAVLEGLGYPRESTPYDLRADWSRIGVGISDDFLLAQRLSQLFFYTNSFYHQFPTVDITDPPQETHGRFEFVVCSDVLEHVPPPADAALIGIQKMLKPGGFAVLTVPCHQESVTREYYPDLCSWTLKGGALLWVDADGASHVDSSPEMHGGAGQTLAFRHWSRTDLMNRALTAGFTTAYSPLSMPPIDLANSNLDHAGIVIARR